MTIKAYAAIQCVAQEDGRRGTFLFTGADSHKSPNARLVSPVLSSFHDLCEWMTSNEWAALPYDSAHPVGVYSTARSA